MDGLIGIGKDAAVILHDLAGRLLQVAGPVIIAQPLPQLHEPILLHRRQISHSGQFRQKASVVVQHRRHPGLLEHDLADPYMVGGGVAAPGQHPGIFPIPLQQRDGKQFQGFQRHTSKV